MAEIYEAITLKVVVPPPIILIVNFKGEFLSSSDGEDYKRGYEEGHAQGIIDGQAEGYTKGYKEGHTVGSESGYQTGKQDGLTEGYDNGYAQGKADGYKDGYDEGYQIGYTEGYEKGKAEGGEFIGIKYLEIDEATYGLPTVVDARSLQFQINHPQIVGNSSIFSYMFANQNRNDNGGQYVKMREVYLPDNMLRMYSNMFMNCRDLTTIHGDFSLCKNLDGGCFNGCVSLVENPYMPNLENIYGNAFVNCLGLTSISIYKKLTTFTNNAFNGCTNLIDIYVPWSEDEVANAPWGATNATIHYNTHFDENHNPIILEV